MAMREARGVNPLPLTILAAGALAWAGIIVTIAALGSGHTLPRVFHSSHFEHFIAFYGVGVLATAGLPAARLKWIFPAVAMVSVVFGTLRYFIIQHTQNAALEDCAAELGGAACALIPILVGMHRQSFRSWMTRDKSDVGGGRA